MIFFYETQDEVFEEFFFCFYLEPKTVKLQKA